MRKTSSKIEDWMLEGPGGDCLRLTRETSFPRAARGVPQVLRDKLRGARPVYRCFSRSAEGIYGTGNWRVDRGSDTQGPTTPHFKCRAIVAKV